MKTKVTLICCLLCCLTPVWGRDFLAENNAYLLHFFQKSGSISHLYLECEKDMLTAQGDKNLHFKIGGKISWNNVRSKFAACWYIFNFGQFDIDYQLYYREKGGEYKPGGSGEFHYVDTDIDKHTALQLERTRTVAFLENRPFEYEFDWIFPEQANPGLYQFKIELTCKPSIAEPTQKITVGRHYEDGSTNIFCPYESGMHYINGNKGKISHTQSCETNKSGGFIYLNYAKSSKTIHFGNDATNPKINEGYRLIYNHPDAEFPITLSKENAPNTKSIGGKTLYGYVSFLVGIGDASSLPFSQQIVAEHTKCISGYSYPSDEFEHFFYIHYKNQNLYNYIQEKYAKKEFTSGNIQDRSKYGLIHLRSILLQSNRQDCTQFNDVAISKLTDYQSANDYWFSRIYHLRDLNLIKLPSVEIKENSVFKVWNKIFYESSDFPKVVKATGSTFYGPQATHIQLAASKDENFPNYYLGENCILYKVIPQVKIPKSNENPILEKRCVNTHENPAELTPNDFIHLVGKSIDAGEFSPTYYHPEYSWQISKDKVTWENITQDNPFIVNKDILPYQVVMDKEKDLLLNTSILAENGPLYFRQICILHSFASEQESNLYNYPISLNGKTLYYIAVYGENYYGYQGLKLPKEDNFNWIGHDWTPNTQLCAQEQLQENKLHFDFVPSAQFTEKDWEVVKSLCNYKIYHVNTSGEKQLVSEWNEYSIPDTLTQSCSYECVIQFCRDSISKSTKIIKYPPVLLNFKNLRSSAAVEKIDSLNRIIRLKGLRKINTLQFNDQEAGSRFLIRQNTAMVPPQLYKEDWSLLSRTECLLLIQERQWPFEEETGLPLQTATLNQIQAYGLQKQRKENIRLQEEAVQDSIQNNQWKEIQDGNAQWAVLTPREKEKDEYFIKKLNNKGCESEPVKIYIQYCTPVTGNTLSFKELNQDTLFAISGLGNPAIKGSYPVNGGYGPVDPEKGTSYTYQWMRKSNNQNWEPIVVNYHFAAITDSGSKVINSDTKYVSLTENTLKNLKGNYEIARFVHSRLNNDINSQITSISNSVFIMTIDSLAMTSVEIDQDKCPSEEIDITIQEPKHLVNEYTTYIWDFSRSDIAFEILSTGYGRQNNRCIIKNAKKNFSVVVKRFDSKKNLESNALQIPFDVSSHISKFSIVFDDRTYQMEDTLVVNVGSKIELINQTKEAEKCKNTWTLQLQDNFLGDHKIVEGTQSNKVNTSCYLYNLGRNPIQLSTIAPNGCKSTVKAPHILVEGVENKAFHSYFEDQKEKITSLNYQEVGPTYLGDFNQYTVQITTNKKDYAVYLYNSVGKLLKKDSHQKGSQSYSLHYLLPGIYFLQVDQTVYKLIKQ